ncbi:hypothetical protein ACIBF1_14925 [Spirillospora sp. NPDC050679]
MATLKKDMTAAGTEATKSGKNLGNATKGIKGLGPAGNIGGKGLKAVGAGFKSALGPAGIILMLLTPFIEKLVETVTKSKTFKKIVSGAMQGVSKAIKWVKDAAKFVWDWIKGNWPLLLAIVTGPFGLAVGFVIKYWDKIKGAVGKAKDYVVGKFQSLMGFFTSLPGKIAGGLGNVGTTLYNKGKDLILGFINGIKSMAGSIINTIKSAITDKIPAFIRNKLGINSPSLVMMGFGENVGEGMALGIEKTHDKVQGSLGALVDVPAPSAVRAKSGAFGAAFAGARTAKAKARDDRYEFHFHGAVKDPKETSRQFASRLRAWEVLNAVR